MLRAVAGILDRRGAPDGARVEAALRSEGGAAGTHVSGPLALAWTGGPAERSGPALALVDGLLYADPRGGPASPPAPDDQAALLTAWRTRDEATLLGALRGDAALLLWDGTQGLLVRDQFGARTWVFHDDGARLSFATEVVILLALLVRRPAPDVAAIGHWIALSGMPGRRTLYAGVERVPAGALLRLDARRPREPEHYWRPRYRRPEPLGLEAAAARVRAALERAVARRTGTGERTAVQLSGGLDSASVAGIAAASLPPGRRPQRAYSAVFPRHPSVDERELIVQIAARLGLASTRIEVFRGSVLEGALPYVERWSLPPVSPNLFFWLPLLRRAVADGTETLLDGEGGDEMFGLSAPLIGDTLLRQGPRAAAALTRRLPGGRPDMRGHYLWPFIRRWGVAALAPAWGHALSRRVRGPHAYSAGWVRPEVAAAFAATGEGGAWKRHDGPRWWANLVDVTVHGMGVALGFDHMRRRAALAGVVPRHPIADVDVAETVFALPPDLAFDPRFSRPVVRTAVAGLIPDAVRLRPAKSTFDAIFHESLAGPDLPLARALLGDRDARVRAYVNQPAMAGQLLVGEPPRAGQARQHWAMVVWRLLTLELFLRAQEDAGAPRRAAERVGLTQPDCSFSGD